MKRWLSAIMIAIMLIGCVLGTYALAEEASVKSTGSINVRSGPGLDYKSLGTAKKGTTFEYQGQQKKDDRGVVWYRVEYKGSTNAWVSSKYTKLSGASSSGSSSSSGSASSSGSSSSSSAKDEGYGFVKSKGSVNVRKGPGTGYKGLGSVSKGTKLAYLGERCKDERGVYWYKVRYKGAAGWMSGMYSELTKGSTTVKTSSVSGGSSSSSKAEATPKPTAKPTVSPTATPKPASSGTVRVTESLNVRTGPGLAFDSIGTVANKTLPYHGESCTDDRGVTWYRVTFDGRNDAWVSSKYATPSADSKTVATGTAGEVVGSVKANTDVNLRVGPGTKNEKAGTLKKNQSLSYMGAVCTDNSGTEWYMVKLGSGKNAWVCADYVRLTGMPDPTPTPVPSVWAEYTVPDDIVTGDLNWFSPEDVPAGEAEPVTGFTENTGAGELSGTLETGLTEGEDAAGSPWENADFASSEAGQPWDLSALPAMDRAETASALTATVTQAQILSALGVTGEDQLRNHTALERSASGDVSELKISLAPDVYVGGTEGYSKPWAEFDGVVSAFEADLDGDGKDEFAVLYVRAGAWNIAAFEPVTGGWLFSDEITLGLNPSGERFVRLTDLATGKGIFVGNLDYLDGGAAILNGVVYCYANSGFLGEAMFSATNVSYSYVVYGKKFSTDSVALIDAACQNYPYHPEEATSLGIQENVNFIYNDLGGYKPVVDLVNGAIHRENFAGVEMINTILAPCGVEAGYEIYTAPEGNQAYTIILSGGEVILSLRETFEGDADFATIIMQVKNSVL